ncbi:hypothetical protein EK465_23580, partial [Escherichia coli]|nr:hypothetical protein [Escherichia coli]
YKTKNKMERIYNSSSTESPQGKNKKKQKKYRYDKKLNYIIISQSKKIFIIHYGKRRIKNV